MIIHGLQFFGPKITLKVSMQRLEKKQTLYMLALMKVNPLLNLKFYYLPSCFLS